MFCKKCGNKIDNHDSFCSNCGNQIEEYKEEKSSLKDELKRCKHPVFYKISILIQCISNILLIYGLLINDYIYLPMTLFTFFLSIISMILVTHEKGNNLKIIPSTIFILFFTYISLAGIVMFKSITNTFIHWNK